MNRLNWVEIAIIAIFVSLVISSGLMVSCKRDTSPIYREEKTAEQLAETVDSLEAELKKYKRLAGERLDLIKQWEPVVADWYCLHRKAPNEQ